MQTLKNILNTSNRKLKLKLTYFYFAIIICDKSNEIKS